MKTLTKTLALGAIIAGLASCGSSPAPQNTNPGYVDPGPGYIPPGTK